MRRMALCVVVGLCSSVHAEVPQALTFEDIVQRARVDAALLTRKAELARMQHELAAAGRHTRAGPTLEAELGPRKLADGEHDVSGVAHFELPMLAGGESRTRAVELLADASPAVLVAEAVASRLRLRTAYLDAWVEQDRLAVLEAQIDAIERGSSFIRQRVEAGSEAAYEVVLVEGELLRSRSQADEARAALGEAWSRLRALADLPPEPLPVAAPGLPDLRLPDDAASRFEHGVLRQAVEQRRALEAALLDFEQAQRSSRWSIVGSAGSEGEETFATVGAAYRFRRSGETEALEREREARLTAAGRESGAEVDRLTTLFRSALERARRFGPVPAPDSFDDALRAVALRIEVGKDRPSTALPVRRQILDARGAALQRIRDAHVLLAEIDAMTAGEAP